MVTGAFRPSGARGAGHDPIADASDAHEAKIARLSERHSPECDTTSRGRSNAVPGCSRAFRSMTLSVVAVVYRMTCSILKTS